MTERKRNLDGDRFSLPVSNLASISDDKDSIIGLKSTAHYGDNLVRYLVDSYCQVCVQPY